MREGRGGGLSVCLTHSSSTCLTYYLLALGHGSCRQISLIGVLTLPETRQQLHYNVEGPWGAVERQPALRWLAPRGAGFRAMRQRATQPALGRWGLRSHSHHPRARLSKTLHRNPLHIYNYYLCCLLLGLYETH